MINNNKDIQHSAAGSHWEKKNHKYIRKEGNRYIYPEDLKRISQQHANRQAAKNGKLVNPIATYRDENGNVALRLHTKGAFATPNQADYKQYSKEMSNQAKQKRAAGNNGKERFGKEGYGFSGNQPSQQSAKWRSSSYKGNSIAKQNEQKAQSHAKASNMSATEAKRISQQRSNRKAAANGVKEIYNFNGEPDFHVWGKSDQENAKRQGEYARRNRKQAKALNKQGSVNRQQQAKEFKEYQDWEKADNKKRDTSAKRQTALNNQGKVDRQDQTKHTLYEKKLVERKIPETKEYEKIEVEKTDKSPANNKSTRTSKLKDRVTKAISNLKNKKSKKKQK